MYYFILYLLTAIALRVSEAAPLRVNHYSGEVNDPTNYQDVSHDVYDHHHYDDAYDDAYNNDNYDDLFQYQPRALRGGVLRAVDSVADNRLTTKVLEWSDKLAGRKSTQNMAGKMGKAARPSDNVAAARPTDSYAQPEKLGMKGVWNNVKDQASKLLGSAADRDRPPNRRRVLKKKPPKGVYRDPHAKELEKTYTGPREPNTLPSSWSDETVHRMPKEITSKLKNLSSRFTRERDTATTAPSSSRRSSINSVDSRTRRVSVNSHGSVVAMYVPDASRIRSPPNSPASPSSGSRVGSIPSLLPGSSDTSSNLLTPPIGAGDIWAGKKRRSSVHL